MFSQFFGNYLIKRGLLTKTQFDGITNKQQSIRVKLGLIAVTEGLMDQKKADEINRLQATLDKRFGDLAIDRGYLTEKQVAHLLSQQGNPYLQFLQAITESGYMSESEFEASLVQYQEENHFTDDDLLALKSGDIDAITPIFVHIEAPFYNQHIGLALRNIIRFISTDVYFKPAYFVKEYSFEAISGQYLDGDYDVFAGFAGNGNALLSIANPFAKEEFETVDEDAFDSVCEFVNCINGLFASKLSHEGTDLDMLPPVFYSNRTLVSDSGFYVVPISINGSFVELVIAVDTKIEVK